MMIMMMKRNHEKKKREEKGGNDSNGTGTWETEQRYVSLDYILQFIG